MKGSEYLRPRRHFVRGGGGGGAVPGGKFLLGTGGGLSGLLPGTCTEALKVFTPGGGAGGGTPLGKAGGGNDGGPLGGVEPVLPASNVGGGHSLLRVVASCLGAGTSLGSCSFCSRGLEIDTVSADVVTSAMEGFDNWVRFSEPAATYEKTQSTE